MLLRDAVKGVLQEAIEHEISLKLLNTWAPLTLWYQACHTILKVSSFEPFLQGNRLSEQSLKMCLSKHPTYGDIIQSFDAVSNQTGICKITIGRDVFLYITRNKQALPDQPSIDQTFHSRVEETTAIFQRSLRRFGRSLVDVDEEEDQTRNKRRKTGNPNSAADHVVVAATDEESGGRAASSTADDEDDDGVAADPYWDSMDARNLFGARPQDVNVIATIKRKTDILQIANQQVKGYKLVIEGGDPKDECTESDSDEC